MGAICRLLLIWCLVLALPAHALTVATMGLCGAARHAAATATTPTTPTHHHAAEMSAHDHAAMLATEAAPSANPASSASPVDDSHVLAKFAPADTHKCSACAACAAASALPSPPLVVPAPDFIATQFAAIASTVIAFTADGPERPPKPAIA